MILKAPRLASLAVLHRNVPLPRGTMTITQNGKLYTAKKLNDNEWQLTSVSAPRDKLTLNRWQMHVAGHIEQVEVKV